MKGVSQFNKLFGRAFRTRSSAKTRTSKYDFNQPPFHEVPSHSMNINSDPYRLILKPLAFTTFVGCGSTIACTIWQYEEYRKRSSIQEEISAKLKSIFRSSSEESQQQPRISDDVKKWWKGLSPGERIFWPICAINIAVWTAWRVPGFSKSMVSLFSATPISKWISFPLLFSTFSHYGITHLAANMFVLHSFMPAAAQIMGKEQFLAFYLTSAVVSSYGSHIYKLCSGTVVPSLGASGAIMGVLGLVCTRMPDIKLGVIFLPGINFSADTALKCILAIDTVGLIAGWRFLDHAAHLSGCLFGIAFSYLLAPTYWNLRDQIMTSWHKFRTNRNN